MKTVNYIPSSGLVEEAVFDVLAAATRESPTIDGLDWFGAKQQQFAGAGARQYGFPFIDLAFRNPGPGGVNLIYQLATQTLPEAAPPVLTFSDALLIAVPALSWERLSGFRVGSRFSRFQLSNVSGGNITGFYWWISIRSA